MFMFVYMNEVNLLTFNVLMRMNIKGYIYEYNVRAYDRVQILT